MNPLLDEALACLARGWSILPIHAGNERDKDSQSPMLMRTGYVRVDEQGKRSASWKPLQTVRPTPEQVEVWFRDPSQKGLALITGHLSGRIVVDFDGQAGCDFAHQLGIRPHVRTGGGGYHWHLAAPAWPVRNMVGKVTAGAPDCVDIRGDGGNAVLPPTTTRKGHYVYLRDPADMDAISDLPMALREALGLVPPVPVPVSVPSGPLPSGQDRFPADRILDWAVQKVHRGDVGGRNDMGYRLAWVLFNNGYLPDEVRRVGDTYVALVGQLNLPAYTHDEFLASMRSALSAPRGDAWGHQRPGETVSVPRTGAEALEDIFSTLEVEAQARGAYLLAREWAVQGRAVEQTVRYLRLMGHAEAARTVRQAYVDHELQRPLDGTLAGFLSARRVRYG
ncbi:bifunctional DNA primase/polymerase [Deinococcus ruber]|uniref:DNA primase/polymerase bifunctional N-terminal domain-containing protein n=1 Tax=Deinococcus ruber TaxID=1848197 RepID=A0A918F6K3_9DEIO|nr:bifunctional DNA primase/polymerase [Deinococcus ruber]GGR12777.1 hypothetical protein GCM10008957_27140 [Deinococcus ruber]